MRTLQGISASRGIVVGPAFRFRTKDLRIERLTGRDKAAEKQRLHRALGIARQQLEEVRKKAAAETGEEEATIFETHALMLEDPELIDAVEADIDRLGVNAEAALHDAASRYARTLAGLKDEYLRARAADVRDVARRVLRILLDESDQPMAGLTLPSIILAGDLTPSDTVMLDKRFVLGFCTAEGGATSHTAILARSLGLPAIVGAGPDILQVSDGTTMIVDGAQGTLVVDPSEELVQSYREQQGTAALHIERARKRSKEPAITRDGHRVEIVANIGNIAEARAALESGAEGVGLLRTEFLYLERTQLPDEEEQYRAYRAITDVFGEGAPIVLRTLDVGGDKEIPYLNLPAEFNPFLGQRAIRLCLSRHDLFRPQLRAVLRAGAGRNLKVMFPMVATVDEVKEARRILEDCRAELRAEGKPVAEKMEIGIMVEIPAAAIMADHFARVVDFFSIGTNDLSQYTLAADRTNSRVSPLANAFSPAVLRLVGHVIEAAHAAGKWVGLCGELAGEPLAIPVLLGLGLDEFSMNSPAIPLAKEVIRALSRDEAREIAKDALALPSPEAIQEFVQRQVPATSLG